MLRVQIGHDQREWGRPDDVDETWIGQQFERQAEGQRPPCVIIRIETDGVNIVLATPGCPATEGVARELHPDERHVVELWNDRCLNTDAVSLDRIVAFLRRLDHIV